MWQCSVLQPAARGTRRGIAVGVTAPCRELAAGCKGQGARILSFCSLLWLRGEGRPEKSRGEGSGKNLSPSKQAAVGEGKAPGRGKGLGALSGLLSSFRARLSLPRAPADTQTAAGMPQVQKRAKGGSKRSAFIENKDRESS